ncbi:MAG: cbb3-type cytochrome c oxidase subunit I [Planctomycetia bacterium]|nr:MAG: cbb3-type cytochrome c oxidase subunit I [Planctomycetia bacterium]
MSSLNPAAAGPLVGAPATDNYLTHSRGFWSWAATLDHKRIGVMYLVGIFTMFLVGGLFAVLLRSVLLTPDAAAGGVKTIVDANMYNRFFTLHGAVMVFIVIIPGIPAALGNFVLPLMLGAKDVAFPRLNLCSFYLWLIGTGMALSSLYWGGVDTGWTFYTPYSTKVGSSGAFGGVVPVVAGAFVLGFSSIFTGLNFIVTIHKLRPPGMTWFRMPLFLWGTYATAVIQVLATPVLGITLLLLLAERLLGIGFFDSELGGDPVLFQHFFWFYSHPAVYIMILPAMGVMSELISVFSHKHIFGYKFIAFSSVAIAILGFLVWGHHMFTSGQSELLGVIFSAITFSIAIPSAVKMFNWLTTLYKGSIDFKAPMCYALSFMWIFGIGGLTGLFLGMMGLDQHLHDTYFVVAHFHYVMAGTIFVFFGAIHYWWPKMTGRMYDEGSAVLASILMFIGFNLTFFVQFMMGTRGMPRRYYEYRPEFQMGHVISSIGSYVMLAAVLLLIYTMIRSLRSGRPAPANPWGAGSMEWQCASPPPHDNFKTPPPVVDAYDYESLEWDERVGGYVHRGRRGGPAAAH